MKFSETHEWIKAKEGIGIVGITNFAQKELGEIVHIELPKVGDQVEVGQEIAVVESVKAASDVYAAVSGEVIEVNEALEDEPGLVNSSAEEDGWFFRLTLSDKDELADLMDEKAYKAFVDDL